MSLPEELRQSQLPRPRGLRASLSSWLERHVQTLVGSLGRLARQPFATGLTVIAIGIALALPAALHLVVVNSSAVTAGLGETVQLSAYLRLDTTPEQARKVHLAVQAQAGVGTAVLVSPDEGLTEFRRISGIGEALKALEENPLPWAIQLRPAPGHDSEAAVEALGAALRELPEVELVEADTAWVRRLNAILAALRQLVMLTAGLLALGVLAIIGNTIRLEIHGRRAEIEVTKLVGGSNGFVRRPFLYSGFWHGLAGGLLAALMIGFALLMLEGPMRQVANSYGGQFVLAGLSLRETAILVGSGAVLGWLGAWVTAAYHLRRIEPRA